jgi:hypothetical protein
MIPVVKRILFSACLLLALACGKETKEKSAPAPSKKPPVAAPAPAAAPAEVQAKARVSLLVRDFHTPQALRGLSPEAARVAPASVADADALPASTQMRFTRVKGGDGYFCGTTHEGPIQCWGKRKDRIEGRFVDLAVGEAGLCSISLEGALSCEKAGAPPGRFSHVEAEGKNYCALTQDDEVKCWGQSARMPPLGLKAQFIAVGGNFACAADPTRRLVCWGETMPLMLPIDPLVVKDIAAGQRFLCVLTPDGAPQCFGEGPRLPEGRYSTVNAAFEQVCGITMSGSLACAGTVPGPIEGDTRRFAIGKQSLCAHLLKNELQCIGLSAFGQLTVPEEQKSVPPAPELKIGDSTVSAGLWLSFLEMFPQQKLPQDFQLGSEISLGDRVPARFEPLLGDDPNRFRVGVGFEFPHHTIGVTLFDLKERALFLYLFQDGRRVDQFALLKWNKSNGEVVNAAEGTGTQTREALSRIARINKDGAIESEELSGVEKSPWVKAHEDGSRPVSLIDCQIQQTTWTNEITPTGKTNRKSAHTKRAYAAMDKEGCKGRAPFD